MYFLNYLPLEKGGALHLNKFESPFPNLNTLCQLRLKLMPSGSGEEEEHVKSLQRGQR